MDEAQYSVYFITLGSNLLANDEQGNIFSKNDAIAYLCIEYRIIILDLNSFKCILFMYIIY